LVGAPVKLTANSIISSLFTFFWVTPEIQLTAPHSLATTSGLPLMLMAAAARNAPIYSWRMEQAASNLAACLLSASRTLARGDAFARLVCRGNGASLSL